MLSVYYEMPTFLINFEREADPEHRRGQGGYFAEIVGMGFWGPKFSAMRPFWAKNGQFWSKKGQKWPKMAKNGKNHSFLGPFWPKTSQIRAYRRFFDPSAQARV